MAWCPGAIEGGGDLAVLALVKRGFWPPRRWGIPSLLLPIVIAAELPGGLAGHFSVDEWQQGRRGRA